MDGDFYNVFIEKLLVEVYETSKIKIEMAARATLLERKLITTNKDLEDIANKFHQLKALYDKQIEENESLKLELENAKLSNLLDVNGDVKKSARVKNSK